MGYAYFGSTSTRKQETSIFRGSVGVVAMPMDFGSSDYLKGMKNDMAFPPIPEPQGQGQPSP